MSFIWPPKDSDSLFVIRIRLFFSLWFILLFGIILGSIFYYWIRVWYILPVYILTFGAMAFGISITSPWWDSLPSWSTHK